MLKRVSVPEMLPEAFINHVKPLCVKMDCDPLHVVAGYCKDLMESNQTNFASWEPRILSLLPFIPVDAQKITTLLDVMRRTPIPWSSELDSQIENMLKQTPSPDCSSATFERYQELKEQFKLMNLKKVMNERYGVKKFNVADITLSKKIVPFILHHVDVMDAVSDALQCVDIFNYHNVSQIIIMRAQNLINSNKTEQLELLLCTGSEMKSASQNVLSKSEQLDVLNELSIWILTKIDRFAHSRKLDIFQNLLDCAKLIARLGNDSSR